MPACQNCELYWLLLRAHGSADPHNADFGATARLTDLCIQRGSHAANAIRKMIIWMTARGITLHRTGAAQATLPAGTARHE